MSEEQKKTEEGNEGETKPTEDNQTVNINASSNEAEADSGQTKTMAELDADKQQASKMKNLTSAVILLAGLLIGSLFVDAAQFFSASGYSERALKNAEVFEGAGKTWVAYTDPIVKVKVLTVKDEELKDCPKCDPTEVVSWLRKFMPTVVADKVELDSAEGKKMVEAYGVKSVPAFVFDGQVKDTEFYNGEANVLFDEKEDHFVLNTGQLGVPAGKFLENPPIAENDPVMGNKDAKVKMVVFSDFQCPYCKMFYSTMTKVAKEYGDKVALTYKEFPLDIHKQANAASMAGLCAQEQGKYWQMADLLYANQAEWGKTDKKDIYKAYARRIGLDANKFAACIDQDKFSSKIEEDMKIGAEYGVSGTPSGFVGSQFLGGVVQEEDLKKMIDAELDK